MAQNWLIYAGGFLGLLSIVTLVVFLKRRDTLMYKQLGEIRNSQAELLRKVSGSEIRAEFEPDIPRAPAFRLPSQDPSGLSPAEGELLKKVRAVQSGSDSASGDHAR